MKKVVGFLFLVAVSVFLYSCTGLTLEAPTVTLSGDTISWSAVPTATQYFVYIYETSTEPGTDFETITTTSFDLSTLSLTDGTYNVYVIASSGASFSAQSNLVEYIVSGGSGLSLNAPTGVTITGHILTWNAVTDATGYKVVIGTTEVNTTSTSYDLSTVSLADGAYNVYVIATAGSSRSTNSATVSYTVSGSGVSVPTTPTNVSITGSIISWTAVTDAVSYIVTINGTNVSVTTTSYDLSNQTLTAGNYPVTVIAVNTAGQSAATAAVTYTVTQMSSVNAIIAGVLPIINPVYEPNMVLSDFDEAYEYADYMQVVAIVTIYANASEDVNLATADAIGVFSDMATLMDSEDPLFTNLETFMATTSMFEDNHVTPEVLAHILTAVGTEALALGSSQMMSSIETLETELLALQQTLALNTSYQEMLTIIDSNTPVTAEAIAALLDANDDYTRELLYIFLDKCIDINNNDMYSNDYYYRDYLDNQDVDMMISIAEEVAAGDDASFIDNATTYRMMFDGINYLFSQIDETNDHIYELNMLADRLDGLDVMLNDSPETIESALSTVFEFMFTVRASMPANIIELIDTALDSENGLSGLSTADIILIKNEFVDIISDALPDEATFQTFFQSMLMIGEIALNNDISNIPDHADYLGSVSYNMINIELMFIGDITLDDVTEIQALITAFETAYGEDGNPLENPTPLIDMIVYARTYLNDFITLHQTDVDTLEILLGSTGTEAVYLEILSQLTAFATDQNPRELDMILYILDALNSEYDHIMTILGIAPDIADGLLTAFVDSEASIFGVIMAMQNMEQPTLSDIVTALESLIDEAALYHDVLASQFTLANIESILSMMVIPAMAESGLYADDTMVATIQSFIPDVAQIILNVASIEGDMFDALQTLVIGDYINETNGFTEPVDVGSALAFIHLFDSVLTPANETLIDDTLDIIFIDILGDATLQTNIGVASWQSIFRDMLEDETITLTDPINLAEIQTHLSDIRLRIETVLDEFMSSVHAFALIDVTTLTPEQEVSVMQFAAQYELFINTSPEHEDQLANAIPLTEGVVDTSLYLTDEMYYTFTPTVSGYYEFTATFSEEHSAYVEAYGGMNNMWFISNWNDGTSISLSGFMNPNETVYVVLDIENAAYVDVDAVMTELDVPELTLDVPVDMSFNDYISNYYVYTPTTDGYYEVTINGAGEIHGQLRIIDNDGNYIVDRYVDDNMETHFYLDAAIGVPFFFEIVVHEWSSPLTIEISEFMATSLEMDVAATVPSSTSAQYYAFTVPTGGPYTIELTSTQDITFDLRHFGNRGDLQNGSFEIIANDTLYLTNFLAPNQVYILEVTNMTDTVTFDITLTGYAAQTVTLINDASIPVTADHEYFFELVIDEHSLYQIDFTTTAETWILGDVLKTDGEYIYGFSNAVDLAEGFHPEYYFVPGTYFVRFSVNADVTIDVGLQILETPVAHLDEELFIEIQGYTDVIMLFTPNVSGEYMIYSYSSEPSDPYIEVFDMNGYAFMYDDNSGEGLNFEVYTYLESGQTYAIHFSNYDDMVSYNARIELVEEYMN